MKKVLVTLCIAFMTIIGIQVGDMNAAHAQDVWCFDAGVCHYYVIGDTVNWDHEYGVLSCDIKQVARGNWIGIEHYRFLHDNGLYFVRDRMKAAKNVYDDYEATMVYNVAKDIAGYY